MEPAGFGEDAPFSASRHRGRRPRWTRVPDRTRFVASRAPHALRTSPGRLVRGRARHVPTRRGCRCTYRGSAPRRLCAPPSCSPRPSTPMDRSAGSSAVRCLSRAACPTNVPRAAREGTCPPRSYEERLPMHVPWLRPEALVRAAVLLSAAVLAALASPPLAAAQEPGGEGGTVRMLFSSDVDSLDPGITYSHVARKSVV